MCQTVPDEAHKACAFSQTLPVPGGQTADTVGKWTASNFAGVVNTLLTIQGNLCPSLWHLVSANHSCIISSLNPSACAAGCADEVLHWVKDIGLEAILDKVMPPPPMRSQLYFGSNDLQRVDHEVQLYEPIRAAIYDHVNQAASILGVPSIYYLTRYVSGSSHRFTSQCKKSRSWRQFFPTCTLI